MGEMEVRSPSYCIAKRRAMQRLAAFVSLLVLCFYLPLVWAQKPAADTLALIQFKQRLDADPTGYVSSSWNVDSLDAQGCPKNWYGVNCSDNGRVSSVSLESLALQGELVSGTLGSLTGLLYLSLSNNSLRGKLPDDLGSLSGLSYMNLSHNRLDGIIPSSMVNLPSLTNLSLAGNGISGSIPMQLGLSLIELDLSQNKLGGQLPGSLIRLQHLVTLNLSNNLLSGSIPSGLQNLVQLETLDFHGNQLSGSIDPGLLKLNKARFVDLSSNSFTGGLPWQQSQTGPSAGFSVIEYINLSHNQISDSLNTAGVIFATKLKVLDISDNELNGELPSFEYVSSLTTLRLSKNAFSGSMPSTLFTSSTSILTELDLSMNQLTGPINSITSSFLITLNLSKNMLSGSLPTSVGPCQSLDLSYNNFSGDLSVIQGWGQTLKMLDLSNNELTGVLSSADLNQLYQLNFLNLSHNSISGLIAQPFGTSQVLSAIDLSFNQIGGGVPLSFFYSSLTYLLLSHNKLTGQIPLLDPSSSAPGPSFSSSSRFQVLADVSTLSPLLVLDLSSNSLNGSIPGELGSISTLELLNLGANKLSGPIPPQLNNLSSLQDLDLSENQLSGPLPLQLPKSLTELNVSSNNLSGPIPKSLTIFPQSSFFPGNAALIWPITSPPRPFPPVNARHRRGMKSNVKAGLIGGCTAGAALVFAVGIFIYLKSSRSHDATPASSTEETKKAFERRWKLATHTASEFGGDVERGAPNVLPVVAMGKSVSCKMGRSGPTENGSPELKVESDTGAVPARNHRFPAVTDGIMSPVHPVVSKASPEEVIDMKMASPEQLVGDVFFLDKALSYSAEDLSRAPAEVLGRSNHGTSYQANLDADHVFVVKWLKGGLAKNRKEFAMEARKFGNIKHQNIVTMKGYYWGPREHEKLILSDYIAGGSLANRLQERTELSLPPLTWLQRVKVAVDVSRGLMYLHAKHRWAHGNIKASNILLTEDSHFEARLSDYSLHRLMTSAGIANQVVNSGALGYCAPEISVAKKPKLSMKSDVFSFGVILMELITGKSAGDIVSGSTGIVDLPDWVRVVTSEGHAIDCYDTALVGVDRDLEPPMGIERMLDLSLSCTAPQSSRPSMRVVHEGLAAINPD